MLPILLVISIEIFVLCYYTRLKKSSFRCEELHFTDKISCAGKTLYNTIFIHIDYYNTYKSKPIIIHELTHKRNYHERIRLYMYCCIYFILRDLSRFYLYIPLYVLIVLLLRRFEGEANAAMVDC